MTTCRAGKRSHDELADLTKPYDGEMAMILSSLNVAFVALKDVRRQLRALRKKREKEMAASRKGGR
jgi:hypothetical protein